MINISEKGRKRKIRCIEFSPDVCVFQPLWCSSNMQDKEIVLRKDEVEALRLKNIEWFDIVSGGEKMEISKSTFARIYESCVNKIADAIVNSKRIVLEK